MTVFYFEDRLVFSALSFSSTLYAEHFALIKTHDSNPKKRKVCKVLYMYQPSGFGIVIATIIITENAGTMTI